MHEKDKSGNILKTDTIYTYQLKLQNNGIGPAIFESFEVFIDDKRICVIGDQSPWLSLNNLLKFRQSSWFNKGKVFRIGEKRSIIKCIRNSKVLQRLKIKITYKSIYEDMFQLEQKLDT